MVERMLDLCDWQDPQQLQFHNAIWFWLTERHI